MQNRPTPDYSTKPFFAAGEAGLKPRPAMKGGDQTTGFDHVGHHHRFILPPSLQDIPFRHPKTESPLGLRQPGSP
jgi:hypothetical protein